MPAPVPRTKGAPLDPPRLTVARPIESNVVVMSLRLLICDRTSSRWSISCAAAVLPGCERLIPSLILDSDTPSDVRSCAAWLPAVSISASIWSNALPVAVKAMAADVAALTMPVRSAVESGSAASACAAPKKFVTRDVSALPVSAPWIRSSQAAPLVVRDRSLFAARSARLE